MTDLTSDDYTQELLQYWKQVENLSPDVKRVVTECWDETGRQTSKPYSPIVMLLEHCNEWKEFVAKYTEMMELYQTDISKIQDEAAMYWSIYVAGILRITKDD